MLWGGIIFALCALAGLGVLILIAEAQDARKEEADADAGRGASDVGLKIPGTHTSSVRTSEQRCNNR